MMKRIVLALALFLSAALPAAAQFADQATYAGTGAGSANAQTLTLSNATSYADLVGVIIKYVPAATNTGAATLTVNGFGSSPAFRKPNGSGQVALTGGELVAGQPTSIMYDGTYFNVMTPTVLPVGIGNLTTSAFGFNVPANLQLNGTVGSNQLTIAVKTAAGTDATATNPIPIAFRDTTIANGDPVWVSITGALSFTIGSGSTMGCTSAQMCRLWIVAINNGGTAALCAFNALSGTSIASINEAILQSSASGTSGGNSAQTYYCSASSVASKAIRILGYVEIQEVTAGTWAAGPTYVQLFGPGVYRPGQVVQEVYTRTGSNLSTTSTYAISNTPPGAGDGGAALSQGITVQSGANVVQIDAQAVVGIGSGSPTSMVAYLLDGSTNIATSLAINSSGGSQTVPVGYRGTGIAGSKTYGLYYSATGSGAAINGTNGVPYLGGTGSTFIRIKEIMGSLEPANDDLLRKVG